MTQATGQHLRSASAFLVRLSQLLSNGPWDAGWDFTAGLTITAQFQTQGSAGNMRELQSF